VHISDNKAQGKGTYHWGEDESYSGDWYQGMKHGIGTYIVVVTSIHTQVNGSIPHLTDTVLKNQLKRGIMRGNLKQISNMEWILKIPQTEIRYIGNYKKGLFEG
jgi:hypothetical protein